MTHSPDSGAEVRRLLESLYESSITPGELLRLEELLRRDTAARQLYRDFSALHANLLLALHQSAADVDGSAPW